MGRQDDGHELANLVFPTESVPVELDRAADDTVKRFAIEALDQVAVALDGELNFRDAHAVLDDLLVHHRVELEGRHRKRPLAGAALADGFDDVVAKEPQV